MELTHREVDEQFLSPDDAVRCMLHLKSLWGFDVDLQCVNAKDEPVFIYTTVPEEAIDMDDVELFGGIII